MQIIGFILLALFLAPTLVGAAGVVATNTEASLRLALSGGGTVTFSNNSTITLGAEIVINQVTTIDAAGHNVVISGSNAVPLFEAVSNLTLRGVSLVNGANPNPGGALRVRPGAIVVAKGCTFSGNSTTATNGFAGINGATNSASAGGNGTSGTQGISGFGGAIYNQGSLALVNCTLTDNTATAGSGGTGGTGGPGDGIFSVGGNGGDGGAGGIGFGGAIYNLGNLTLNNCTFSGNRAIGGAGGAGGAGGSGNDPGLAGNGGPGGNGSGGAVYNARNLTVLASTFSSNAARGGASATAGMRGNGTGLTGLKGAEGSGGAIFNDWWSAITNCTFYTNVVVGGAGGTGGNGGGTFAIPGDGGDGGDAIGGALDNANTVTIVSCTFSTGGAFGGTNGVAGSGNSKASAGNLGVAKGGNIANPGSVLTLVSSILTAGGSGGNAFGSFTDGGYNLSSDSVQSFDGLSIQNRDPKLGALAAHGGPTLTMALLTGSPAIDRIGPALSPPADQRGFARPINGLSDIGAFEFGAGGVGASNVVLTVARTANGLIQINGAGTVGLNYVIEASTNFVNWQSISTNAAPIIFTDPITNFPIRVYRISR